MVSTDKLLTYTAKEICRKAKIPEPFTRKTFQALVRGKFLRAATGPGGGYRLAKDARSISVLDVVEAVDGKDAFSGCVMGFSECGGKKPCSLHEKWKAIKEHLVDQLGKTTLYDLHQNLHAVKNKK